MKRLTPWRISISLLTAACLSFPISAWAAEDLPPARTESAGQESSWLELSNAWTDRLERYCLWAVLHPELEREEVVFQVNLDLDRTPYDDPRTVEDPASLTVLVNKHNALPKDYVPELEAVGTRYGTGSLRPEAAQAFREMADAARKEGITLRSVSAYRSYQRQASTYSRYLTQYRQKTVDTFSARPGHSEHQTGLALDINVASTKAHFEKTPAFAWLMEHCAQFGFILRYDQGKEKITGYRFEPWHYRYVGVEIAKVCMEQGLSYEEYLALGLEPASAPEEEPPQKAENSQQPEPPKKSEAVQPPKALPPVSIGAGSPMKV